MLIVKSLKVFLLIALSVFLFACQKEEIAWKKLAIKGRTPHLPAIYTVRFPSYWESLPPGFDEELSDTTLPIHRFIIDEDIIVTIHNFPLEPDSPRIPPMAQLDRWKKQFTVLNESFNSPISQSGLVGHHLKAWGLINDQPTTVFGWAFQLAHEHYIRSTWYLNSWMNEVRGDVTIKVTGPTKKMEKIQEELSCFAASFEFVDDLPMPY
ncbi:MAG: hypothetical protein Tsb0021_04300 [Chlamydiales bacterium]